MTQKFENAYEMENRCNQLNEPCRRLHHQGYMPWLLLMKYYPQNTISSCLLELNEVQYSYYQELPMRTHYSIPKLLILENNYCLHNSHCTAPSSTSNSSPVCHKVSN